MIEHERPVSSDESAGSDPFVQRVAQQLVDELPALVDDLVGRILGSDAFYAHVSEAMAEEVRRSTAENLGQLLRGLAGYEPLDFELPRRLASERAEQGVPIAALLHAYRLAAEVVCERVVEAGRAWGGRSFTPEEVLDGAARTWTLTNHYSSIISQAYDETMGDRVRRSERERSLLLDALFDGRPQDASLFGEVAHHLDLPSRGTFVVVVAENPAPGQVALAGIEQRLRALGSRSAWRLATDRQTGVVVLGGSSRHDLSLDAVREQLEATAVARVGISPVYRELASTARHVLLADLARRCEPPCGKAVAWYDDHPVATLVAASPSAAARAVELVLGPVLLLPPHERELLLLTLQAWIDSGGSAVRAGERLFCHRNTVRNRLGRLEALTGRSLAAPGDVTELCVALSATRLLGDAAGD